MLSSNVTKVISALKSGDIVASSEFRNEDAQKVNKQKRIPNLKKEPNKKSRLLCVNEIALPFDPTMGKETPQFNRNNKFRPLMSQTTAMKVYKGLANENEDTKRLLLQRTGIELEDWDTSNPDELTDMDRKIFAKHKYPMIFTMSAVNINIPVVTGSKFGKDYKIDVERDKDTNEVIGEMPTVLKINKLMRDLANEEMNRLNELIKKGELNLTEADLKTKKSEIYSKILVSDERPVNYILALEIPLDHQLNIKDDFNLTGLSDEDIFNMLRLIKYTSKIETSILNYMNGTYHKSDTIDNFWVLDMLCSDDQDKKQLGINTKFERPDERPHEIKDIEELQKSYVAFMDEDRQLENIFKRSVFVSNMTPIIEGNLLDKCSELISLDSENMTKKVIEANQDIIIDIFAAEGEQKLMECGLGFIAEGSLDEEQAKKDANDFTSLLTSNDDYEEDIPL